MIRFLPDAAARCNTSKVAAKVVTMPVTGVFGLPALNVSTVPFFQEPPVWALMRSITCRAVRVFGFSPNAESAGNPENRINSSAIGLRLKSFRCIRLIVLQSVKKLFRRTNREWSIGLDYPGTEAHRSHAVGLLRRPASVSGFGD